MAREYHTFDHPADIGLEASGDSLAELLTALAEGTIEQLYSRASVADVQMRRLAVEAEDVEALTVDFLAALVNLIQADHFMVGRVQLLQGAETSITAEVCGEPFDAARHELETEIKAVTYHQLRVVRVAGRWTGRVILDI